MSLIELVASKSEKEIGFADARGADQDDFEHVVMMLLIGCCVHAESWIMILAMF